MKRQYVYRSAKTGRYCTKAWAEKNPDTTMRMTVKQDEAYRAKLSRTRKA